MKRPGLPVRVSVLMAVLSAPVLLALFVVFPVYGAHAAVVTGFITGIPAVLFATWRIIKDDWLDES